jgi:hypothetical protein
MNKTLDPDVIRQNFKSCNPKKTLDWLETPKHNSRLNQSIDLSSVINFSEVIKRPSSVMAADTFSMHSFYP